ncbi:MAG: CsbD family protein [Rhodothermales bacterium]
MDTPLEQQMEGTWKRFKGRLKEAWGTLTDDELDKLEGKRDQIEGLIEQKTGESREKVRREVDRLTQETKYRF